MLLVTFLIAMIKYPAKVTKGGKVWLCSRFEVMVEKAEKARQRELEVAGHNESILRKQKREKILVSPGLLAFSFWYSSECQCKRWYRPAHRGLPPSVKSLWKHHCRQVQSYVENEDVSPHKSVNALPSHFRLHRSGIHRTYFQETACSMVHSQV